MTVLYDGDEAGDQGGQKVAKALSESGVCVSIARYPKIVKDLTEWVVKHGATADDLRRVIAEAVPVSKPKTEEAHLITTGFNLTDLGNAERFVAQNGLNVRYVPKFGKWLNWNAQQWEIDETGEVARMAQATIRSLYQEAANEADDAQRKAKANWAMRSEAHPRLTAMVILAQSQKGMAIFPKALDADPWLFNCQNGTIDLRTGELRPHDRNNLCSKIAPISYDPEAECPKWLAFLHRIMGGAEAATQEQKKDVLQKISFLKRALGYSLSADTREQCFFILYGQGANGKSTLIEVVRYIMGDYAADTPVETLMAQKNDNGVSNDLARLRDVRLVSAGESEEGQRLAEGKLKRLSGGDAITARFLHQEYFEFHPRFKIFLATNHRPIIRDQSDGIWRRIRPIPFEVQIPKEEQDPYLTEKLKAEAPGILAWMVQGCLRWQERGLGMPAAVESAAQVYRDEMDLLGAFIGDCCIENRRNEITAGHLFKAYQVWCEDNGERAVGNGVFGRRMTERGIKADKRGGIQYRHGLKLREDWEDRINRLLNH